MRTLLLRPPPEARWGGGLRMPPIGLASLTGALLEHGHDVTLVDAAAERIDWPTLEALVRHLRPDILGLSAMTPVRETAYRAARRLRRYVRFVVLGGPHPTAVGTAVFEECPAIDFVVRGEGEAPLLELVSGLKGGALAPGVSTRDRVGGQAPHLDLDALPFAPHHLLPLHRYRHPLATRMPVASIVTSRGCPGRCTFCAQSVEKRRWRGRSPDKVLDEMRHLRALGVRFVCVYDDNFTWDRARVVEICRKMTEEKVDLRWKCEARVDCVDAKTLAAMARAGCRTISFGVETASQRSLNLLGKGTSVDQARIALRLARAAGMETLAYVLVGIPGEAPEDVRRTVALCEREGVTWLQVSTLAAEPGTILWEQACRSGWPIDGDVRGLWDDESSRTTVVAPPWTRSQLRKTLQEVHRRVYWRPSRLVRYARQAIISGGGGVTAGQLALAGRRSFGSLVGHER